VAVMYAGRIVEIAPTDVLFSRPDHPYTRALIDAMPQLTPEDRSDLRTIPGQPPDLLKLPEGCPFAPRCPLARDECAEVSMELTAVSPAQSSACPFARDGSGVRTRPPVLATASRFSWWRRWRSGSPSHARLST